MRAQNVVPFQAGSEPTPDLSWNDIGPREHFVQFYEEDGFLVDSVCGYVESAFRGGEAAIVIATETHRAALESRLRDRAWDLRELRAAGQYVSLDAADTLGTFMVNGMPDALLFKNSIGSTVRHAAAGARAVRAFGEMVAVLWEAGNSAAAIRLEGLWNDLLHDETFSLFCAYPLKVFGGVDKATSLLHVCSEHSQVIPAESYSAAKNADERLRAIVLLQQRAASLEAEIDDRKRAECTLRQEQTRLAMAMGVAQLGIWELDLATNEWQCSDQCKAHYGLRPEDQLTHDRLFDLIHPDDRDTVRNTLRTAIAVSGDHTSEHRVLDPQGRVRWISSLGRCFHNGNHRMIGVTLDITERKQTAEFLEQTVAERTARLKETVGEMEAFAYSISHDMRAPLRSMQGFAAILMEDWAEQITPEARVCLERINASADRMDRLIQDVLTFSRVARSDFAPEPVDLAALITGIIDANLQALNPNIAVQGKLPIVLGTTAGLTQCFSNLLSNAAKFVAPGVVPQIRIWSEPLEGESARFVRVFVQDNGIGIPPVSHMKIFEIFYRLHTKYEGTGIGLAIVKKAVERMGGRVGLSSAPGDGSTFWLDLRVPASV